MNKNHVPDWKLEDYLLGELPPGEFEAICELERADESVRLRIEALRASNEEILAKYPPELVLGKSAPRFAGVRGPSRQRRSRGGIPRWAVPAFACAALLLILPVWVILPTSSDGAEETVVYNTRTKGDVEAAGLTHPALEVWRKSGDDAERLAPETAVREGDVVQVRYIVPESCYGALVSMDGRGVMTVHLAADNGKAAPLTPGRPVALGTSYKLDDAPAFEAFYLITAAWEFDLKAVNPVLKSAKHPIGDGQTLPLPQKQVTAFVLRKFSNGNGAN